MENRAVLLIDGPNFYKNLRRCGLEREHLDFLYGMHLIKKGGHR